MPKKFIQRYMPDHRTIRTHRHLQFLGTLLHDPNLWHLNRRSASGGVAVGLFWAFMPMPFQMIPAAICAVWLRVNLPISIALVWITNPITIPPIFWFCYQVGAAILGTHVTDQQFDTSIEWLTTGLLLIWKPFLLGCLVMGVLSSLLGYGLIRGLWRLHLVQHLRRRRERRPPASGGG